MEGKSNERNSLMNLGFEAIDKTMEAIFENFKGEERESALQDLKETFISFERLQEDWVNSSSCIRELKNRIDVDENNLSINAQEEYEKILSEIGNKKRSNKQVSKNFDMKVNHNFNNENDNDIVETESCINLIDPISKKTMVNPVKNIHCHHTYDLDTITEIIKLKNNKKMMCPYQGCGNSTPLKVQDLIPDEVTKRKLLKMANKE